MQLIKFNFKPPHPDPFPLPPGSDPFSNPPAPEPPLPFPSPHPPLPQNPRPKPMDLLIWRHRPPGSRAELSSCKLVGGKRRYSPLALIQP